MLIHSFAEFDTLIPDDEVVQGVASGEAFALQVKVDTYCAWKSGRIGSIEDNRQQQSSSQTRNKIYGKKYRLAVNGLIAVLLFAKKGDEQAAKNHPTGSKYRSIVPWHFYGSVHEFAHTGICRKPMFGYTPSNNECAANGGQ